MHPFLRTTLCSALLLMTATVVEARDPVRDLITTNSSIRVPADEQRGRVSTTNGSIDIGDRAEVGEVQASNGAIRIGEQVRLASVRASNGEIEAGADLDCAGDIHTTNGRIGLGPRARIGGGLRTTNGEIVVAPGSRVNGDLETTNGRVHVDRAEVGGMIRTLTGEIEIGQGSRVLGGIRVGNGGSDASAVALPGLEGMGSLPGMDAANAALRAAGTSAARVEVIIGPEAEVLGELIFDSPVVLWVHETARIGTVRGAQPRRYRGARPN